MKRNDRRTLGKALLVVAASCSVGWYALNHRVSHEKVWTGLIDVVLTDLGPKIGGRLVTVGPQEGDSVAPGEVVLKLDDSALVDELAKARAAAKQAEARRDEITARLRQADHDRDRVDELYEKGSASQHEYVRTRNEWEALDATLKAAEAAVQMSAASVERVQQDLSETEVASTSSGRVLLRAYEPGEVVPPGAVVLSVARMDPLWIYAFVDEIAVVPLKIGGQAIWRTAHGEKVEGTARIVAILPEAQFATQKDKGRFKRDIKIFRVKLEAENPHEALKPGMTVDVVFHLDTD